MSRFTNVFVRFGNNEGSNSMKQFMNACTNKILTNSENNTKLIMEKLEGPEKSGLKQLQDKLEGTSVFEFHQILGSVQGLFITAGTVSSIVAWALLNGYPGKAEGYTWEKGSRLPTMKELREELQLRRWRVPSEDHEFVMLHTGDY